MGRWLRGIDWVGFNCNLIDFSCVLKEIIHIKWQLPLDCYILRNRGISGFTLRISKLDRSRCQSPTSASFVNVWRMCKVVKEVLPVRIKVHVQHQWSLEVRHVLGLNRTKLVLKNPKLPIPTVHDITFQWLGIRYHCRIPFTRRMWRFPSVIVAWRATTPAGLGWNESPLKANLA